ncbi:spore maturation protein [uncultured Eubacterium sp.]|uniref:spore maturation protein n=1 Tax=uncultured Eubacterium sp. TaxID=165185 RepID=UPI002671A7E9|nr:nucleoside recognition domain-containing protein [uncultured Eubacterium sp.]
MSVIVSISSFIIPGIMFFIVIYGIIKKQNVYDDFVSGATGGLKTVIKVMPTLIGLMVAVGVLRESGFMEFLGTWMGKLTNPIGFPGELMPVTIVKIFSSSAATGMVLDIFKAYGPDSYMGKVTSLMMSCTETVFYTMSVYYITAKVTKTRWTLPGAILTTIVGTIASVILANLI